ncbi:uncharacterized protein [Dermacentor andersoni]|uniref:uncharacterized protein isoform X1 n=1 Tax=Dermacentor andersoni TaxID=34620 RepID=UPI003B3B66BC
MFIASLLVIPAGNQQPCQHFQASHLLLRQNDSCSAPTILLSSDGFREVPSSTPSGSNSAVYQSCEAALRATWTIKAVNEASQPKGHGSWACAQMNNPLVFLVQFIASLLVIPAGNQQPCQHFQASHLLLRQNDSCSAPTILLSSDGFREVPSSTPSGSNSAVYQSCEAALRATWTIKAVNEASQPKGHGSWACAQMNNPLVFLVQVRKRVGKCFRSSERCLVVLPCPAVLLDAMSDVVYITKLVLLAGDVETNPGPDMAELSRQLKQIAEDIKEIKEERLTAIDNKLEHLSFLEDKLSSCTEQITNLQQVVSSLELRLDDLENRSRRSNLIVYGMPEEEDENNESLERSVNKKVVKDSLQLDEVAIERIHRLGRPEENKTRPIILKLLDFRDKAKVLRNCHKLKGTAFAISEDFSPRVRDIRRNLWKYGKPEKNSGGKVSLVYDKLKINGELYFWDDVKKDVCLVTSASNQTKNQDTEARTLRPRRQQRPK